MDLSELLRKTESTYKNKLEEYFSRIFSDTILPSHNLSHHRRVWNYAVELLQSLNRHGSEIRNDIPEKLIIGCYLHDSGMAIDRGIRHGNHSRHFCIRFLEENNLEISRFEDLLSAVENHDTKENNIIGKPDDLFSVLSVSDDLDAFGITGIYRYSEIYLARGINLNKLGFLVLENVAKRYHHFIETFGYDSVLLKRHYKRYNEVENFFNEYNLQLKDYEFGNKIITANCGVAEVIANIIKTEPYSFDDIIRKGLEENDETVKEFFQKLSLEV